MYIPVLKEGKLILLTALAATLVCSICFPNKENIVKVASVFKPVIVISLEEDL
jgi:hypothetical protein